MQAPDSNNLWKDLKKATRDAAGAAWDSFNEEEHEVLHLPFTMEDLQHSLLRFEGRFGGQLRSAFLELENSPDSKIRTSAFHLRLGYTSAALDIAVSPRPDLALIDMITLVELIRRVADSYLVPVMFSGQGQSINIALKNLSQDIWELAHDYLSDAQILLLKRVIEDWCQENGNQVDVSSVRLSGAIKALKKQQLNLEDGKSGHSFFLKMNQALDTADKSRMLGERAFYYLQRAPFFMRWHLKAALQDLSGEVKGYFDPEIKKKIGKAAIGSGIMLIGGQITIKILFRALDIWLITKGRRPRLLR